MAKAKRKALRKINKFLHMLVVFSMLLQPIGTPGLLVAIAQDVPVAEEAPQVEKAAEPAPEAPKEALAEPVVVPVEEEKKSEEPKDEKLAEPKVEEPAPSVEAENNIPEEEVIPEPKNESGKIAPEAATDEKENTNEPVEGEGDWEEKESGSSSVVVVENKEYEYKDSGLKIEFSKLKDGHGEIDVKEIELTDEQVESLKAVSKKAWDITSQMQDGDFEYKLTLPVEESQDINRDELKVVYLEEKDDLEKLDEEGKVKEVDEKDVKLDEEKDEITAEGLDHFTVFIIATYASNYSTDKSSYFPGDTVYIKAGGLASSSGDNGKKYKIFVKNPSSVTEYESQCSSRDINHELKKEDGLAADAPIGDWITELYEYSNSVCSGGGQLKASDNFEVTSDCGSISTYEKTGDFSDSKISIDFSNDRKKITVSAESGYEVRKVWLQVDNDGQSGYYLYATGSVNNFNPNPGDDIDKVKVEIERVCQEKKVDICHSTNSPSNPYNSISVSINSVSKCLDANGHGKDPNDIIPPFNYDDCSYPGLNWPVGEAIWNNNCVPAEYCGNRVVDTNEQCDDGNEIDGDACDNQCQLKDMQKEKVKTCTGEGELYLYKNIGNPFQDIDTAFTIDPTSNYDQLLIFTKSTPGAMSLGAKINGSSKAITLLQDDPASSASVYGVDVSPGDLVEISGSAANGAREVQGYLAQDKDAAPFDLTTLEFVHNSITTDPLYLTPDTFQYVFFDKYTRNSPGEGADLRELNIKINGPSSIVDKIYTQPYPASVDGAVVDDYTVTQAGNYTLTVNAEDSIYWVLPKCEREPMCGDGIVDEKLEEQCDDGNVQDGDGCSSQCTNETATIIATKIVCTDENELPNWAANKPEITIDASTATDWINQHDSCSLVSGWEFQWGDTGDYNPGDDHYGNAAGWNNFDTASNASGQASVEIDDLNNPAMSQLKIREVLQDGYIPFTFTTNGYANADPVSAEIYCHNDVGNFDNDDRVNNPQYGQTYYCVAWNVLNGTIHGFKWNDEDGDGEFGEGEEKLSGWRIFIDEGEEKNGQWDEGEKYMDTSSEEGEDFGWYWFEHLFPGEYSVCEVSQNGWNQTYPIDPVCHNINLPYSEDLELTQNAVLAPEYNFGNQLISPQLFIQKSNNRYPTPQLPGADVTYTLTITAQDNDVLGVKVTDLPPKGFVYRPGSWTAVSSVRGNLGAILGLGLTKVYASPGEWSLGDMQAGEVVTLAYLTDIDSNQDPGEYPDLAYARGTSEGGAEVMADNSKGDPGNPFYVGTAVSIVNPPVKVAVELEDETKTETRRKTKTVERVLGASTSLPATGASTEWVVLAILLAILGTGTLIIDKQKKKMLAIWQFIKKSRTLLFGIILAAAMLLAQSAQAATDGNISVQIEDPKTPTTDTSFRIGFVVLDILNRNLTAQCYQTPGDIPVTTEYVQKAGGNSGSCVIDLANGTYQFYVKAEFEGASNQSKTVAVEINADVPGTPTNYDNNKVDDCTRSITFTTANDGGKTAKVELYRSTETEFEVDTSAPTQTLSIGSNTAGSFTDTKPDCGTKYYYAIRAVSAAGLGSDFVGDEDVNVKRKTKTRTKYVDIVGPTSAAIPVTEGQVSVPGTEEQGGAVLGEEGAEAGTEEKEGGVLGEEFTKQAKSFFSGGWPWIILIIAAIIAYVFYYRKKSSQK